MTFKRIAIVYDWMDKWGGVERLLLTLHSMFPEAIFYTSYYDEKTAPWAKDLKIRTSFIQKLPAFVRKNRILSLFLYPYAFESFRLNEFDLVISVSSSFAKSVITRPETIHINYMLTPTRFIWVYPHLYLKGFFKLIKQFGASVLRKWDYLAAQRPDTIITLSNLVKKRCQTYYHRTAHVIYPPFNHHYWKKIKSSLISAPIQMNVHTPFYLCVSRLEAYKRIDLVIEAFSKLPDKHVIIVGHGTMENVLKESRLKNITFYDHISDKELGFLYSAASGLIMPQEEDFGYVSLEAQFFGCPVISYAHSGAAETIQENLTGVLFPQQTSTSIIQALERLEEIAYNNTYNLKAQCEAHTQNFSEQKFRDELLQTLTSYL